MNELTLGTLDESYADVIDPEEVDFQDIERPWNPDDIRVTTRSFSLRNMLDAIEEEGLDLAPDFQRLRVWKAVQKAQLIESILLQIPLPAFYFAEDQDGTLRVVDGVQRLSTIYDYCRGGSDGRGGFALSGLEYVGDVTGMRFKDLPALWQRRIHNTQIIAHVIDPTTPTPVMYDIFRRINTGGTPLNGQEIRHCISRERSRTFLKRLAETEDFTLATGGLLRNQRRMIDREVALRFVAFWLQGPERFNTTMDEFLWTATEALDDPRRVSDAELLDIEARFLKGLRSAVDIFGPHAYRKWPEGDERLLPFNRALFDSWTVELARIDQSLDSSTQSTIRTEARAMMRDDDEYLASITASTGDRRRVETRFLTARSIISRALS
ncbi:DUF262 domain-containing protein [Kineococcus auxinigenes]|uniref:DUF262 domain-containing protein n=1 Tax=unclassified Kineococcus TaxID=2621656 RepID=UPI003D7D4657